MDYSKLSDTEINLLVAEIIYLVRNSHRLIASVSQTVQWSNGFKVMLST